MIFHRKFTRTGALNPALRSHDQLAATAAASPNGALEREGSVSCCRISRPRFVTCNALSVMRSMLTGPNFIICAGRDPRAGPKLFPTYRPATPGASNRFPATASSPRLALMPIDSTSAPAASRAADSPLANHDRTITGVVPSTPIPRGRRAQDRKWPVFVADFGPTPHGGRKENYA